MHARYGSLSEGTESAKILTRVREVDLRIRGIEDPNFRDSSYLVRTVGTKVRRKGK
jgi:hypothetical protein